MAVIEVGVTNRSVVVATIMVSTAYILVEDLYIRNVLRTARSGKG